MMSETKVNSNPSDLLDTLEELVAIYVLAQSLKQSLAIMAKRRPSKAVALCQQAYQEADKILEEIITKYKDYVEPK